MRGLVVASGEARAWMCSAAPVPGGAVGASIPSRRPDSSARQFPKVVPYREVWELKRRLRDEAKGT